jgi:membrane-bound inhibitor of C-type lysozyme
MMLKNIIIIVSVILLFSCQSSKTVKPEENSSSLVQRRIVSETQNNIVYTRITNRQGELLEIIFDNAKNEALLKFKGEDIKLTGEKTASGIKYSNSQYLFTQWKDDIELKKDGKTVFQY